MTYWKVSVLDLEASVLMFSISNCVYSGSVKKVQIALSVHCHDITCCGVAFSDGGQWLCAGDLTGGVWAMQGRNSKATYTCSVSPYMCACLHTQGIII